MTNLLLDTHAVIWFALDDDRLSHDARVAITSEAATGNPPAISVISIIEIVYLAEKGRVPENTFSTMIDLSRDGRLAILPVELDVVEALASLDRAAVPDMPDRIIAATALSRDIPLITCDDRIRTALGKTIW